MQWISEEYTIKVDRTAYKYKDRGVFCSIYSHIIDTCLHYQPASALFKTELRAQPNRLVAANSLGNLTDYPLEVIYQIFYCDFVCDILTRCRCLYR